LRVAIIYVTFKDDYSDGFPYTIWPKPTGNPTIATKPNVSLIEGAKRPSNFEFMKKYNDYIISDFFCEMSLGKFDVIGDEYAVILPEFSTYYKALGYSYSQMNQLVLNEAKLQTNINYSNYNNWSLNYTTNKWEYGNTSDGKAEMIIICYRNVPNNDATWFFGDPGIGGKNILGYMVVTIDNTTISYECGITAINQLYNLAHSLQIIEHEFSHRFLDHYEVGFMPISNTRTTYCYTPYERAEIVDYINFEIIDQNGIYLRTLGDFIETGQTI